MTEPERRAAELRTLLAWTAHQRTVLARVGERLDRAVERAAGGADAELAAAAALFLQHYYTAVEDAFLRIAEDLDGSVPAGDEWHRLLLEQMTLEIPDIRPRVIAPELRELLDVLRRFRHRVRHAYDVEYDWRRMAEPLAARARVAELLSAAFERFEGMVHDVIRTLEGSVR